MIPVPTRRWRSLGAITVMVSACGRAPAPAAAPPPVDIAAENVAVVDSGVVESGPQLSGQLTPLRSAQLRAQVAGAITSILVDEGAAVRAGQVVAVIDTTALAEAVRSAHSQLGSAQLAAEIAQRNYERSQNLHNAGAIADKDLETAHSQAVAAAAQVSDAQNRLTTAEKQLGDAVVRAPWSGVVSARPANVGDVLQTGNPILTIVDPSDLELDGSVPADYVTSIHPGTHVEFSVNGDTGRVFLGHVTRINPTVDSVTRQLKIYVSVPNEDRALAAGLFAEGRVTLKSSRGLVVPISALDTKATSPTVRRLRAGRLESVPVTLGIRDDLAERVEITHGVARGDTVLTGAALSTPAGTVVRVAAGDR